MALTFPRDLPDIKFQAADFYPTDPYSSSRSGRIINVSKTKAYAWRIDLVTVPLRYSVAAEIEAWFLSLRGGLRSCNFVHPHALWPREHFTNQTPAETAGNLVSVTDGNQLSIDGLDAGLELSLGDLIGLENGDLLALGRVVDFSGSGTTREIEIEPTPPPDVAVPGAVVRFAQPRLIMRPVRSAYQNAQAAGLHIISMSFEESRI